MRVTVEQGLALRRLLEVLDQLDLANEFARPAGLGEIPATYRDEVIRDLRAYSVFGPGLAGVDFAVLPTGRILLISRIESESGRAMRNLEVDAVLWESKSLRSRIAKDVAEIACEMVMESGPVRVSNSNSEPHARGPNA